MGGECEARDDNKKETGKMHKAKSVALRESRIWGKC